MCSGATLPPGYTNAPNGDDCDDTNPAVWAWQVFYPDQDGDGAGAPPLQILCEGATVPTGLSRYGDDENDTDPSVGPLPPEDLLGLFLE